MRAVEPTEDMDFVENDKIQILTKSAKRLGMSKAIDEGVEIRNEDLVRSLIRIGKGSEGTTSLRRWIAHLRRQLAGGVEYGIPESQPHALSKECDEFRQILELIAGQDYAGIEKENLEPLLAG